MMKQRGTLMAIVFAFLSCAGLLAQQQPKSPTDRLAAEFQAGLERRGVRPKFDQFRKYTASLLEASRGGKSFSDKTGNCRLAWVEQLLTQPIQAAEGAERFTRQLQAAVVDGDGLPAVLDQVFEKLDARLPSGRDSKSKPATPSHGAPLPKIASVLAEVQSRVARALQPLSAAERAELRKHLYEQSTAKAGLGHRFADKERGRRVADLCERIDRRELGHAAKELATLTNPKLLAELATLEAAGDAKEPAPAAPQGVQGRVLHTLETPQGLILVGGAGENRYDLDKLKNVCAVIDVGGDDSYSEGTTTAERPVLVVLDLAGNDVYRGEKPGIQGGAILGASLLVDVAGNDAYTAADVAQGSALAGVGMLIDGGGHDTYRGDRRVQGQAIAGGGLLIDRGGDDRYRAALLAQGCGGPLGFGLLADVAGKDHYFAGGKYPGGYDDSPGFGGWSQGVGVGPRGVANGGIGVLLDGGGDDVYEADYFSHGGGYWFAAGIARDFGGDDQRLGATRENFDGSPRTVPRFLRWGTAYGCHYAAGFVFDDRGNDTYHADFAGIAYGWDIALAVLCDFDGNDRYVSAGTGVAQTHNAAVALLYDRAGNDEYRGGLGEAEAKPQYHPPEKCGGNFSLLLDDSGDDTFAHGLKNKADAERGWAGGFFVDR
jgi:hypothetical protein